MVSAEVAIQEFISKQKQLLESELRAEEDAESINESHHKDDDRDGGFLLRNIDVIDTSVGLYGRTVITFGSASQEQNESEPERATPNNQNSRASKSLLQAHRLTVGDEVQILPNNGKGARTIGSKSKYSGGVICAVDDVSISVALFGRNGNSKHQSSGKDSNKKQGKKAKKEDASDEDEGEMLGGNAPYALIPRSNVEVHQKMVYALDEVARHGVSHPIAGDIIMAAFEPNNPKHDTGLTRSRIETLESKCNLQSTKLDYSQREAVVMALHSNSPIGLIHGPPGTGKTTTVAELIRCAVHGKGWKVLVTAPSNVAVDNVLDRIISIEENETRSTEPGKRKGGSKKSAKQKRIKAVRLGHPARIQHGIQKYSLESLVQSSEGTEIVKDCRSELNECIKILSNAKSRPSEKRVAYREMKTLRKEIRSREEKVVGEILRDSNVVLATNVGAGSSVFKKLVDAIGEPISFDLVIIDEAAQALEASCWISLLRGKRAILAGDHKQLPPTIKCPARDVQRELGRTLFERLMVSYDKSSDGKSSCHSKMLQVQYRMHQSISDWASNTLYDGKLVSHDSVKGRKLATLPRVAERTKSEGDSAEGDAIENVSLMLIDTTGCDMHETANEAGSRYNEGEAGIVVSHVQSLISIGLGAEDIAVITPYNGQVELLRKLLLPDVPNLEIRSVDGFQGGEREAVVLSLVRSSERGGQDGIGFLRDERRLNVAVTRAKRHCAVICDCETVSKNKFIKGLVDWMEEKGEYRSGAEYNTQQSLVTSESLLPKSSTLVNTIQKESKSKQPKPEKDKPTTTRSNGNVSKEATVECSKPKMESFRIDLMEKIRSFSESGNKADEMRLAPSTEYDTTVARELAKQLGLGVADVSEGSNEIVVTVLKESKPKVSTPTDEETKDTTTSAFAQLGIDDDSSTSSIEEEKKETPQNNLLRELALEREKRQSKQLMQHSAKPAAPKKKKKKKKKPKGQKLGGAKPDPKEENDDLGDIDDDMAFLDAQIEKVQTSHGRKIEAKGKGYRSVVNGILLSKPKPQVEPKRDSAQAASLQAKLKSKQQDRKVKKKK